MKTTRFTPETELETGLKTLLAEKRRRRRFEVRRCIEAKTTLINSYFQSHKLSSAVIGVSGGIDSAATLALLVRAAGCNGSPIKRITPLLLPFSIDQGVSHQEFATSRGAEVVRACGLTPQIIDLGAGFSGIRQAFHATDQQRGDAWADGQLAAYLRTPALYYATALNAQQGFPGIVCGTTNRDEGAYLGFFGKASDGMVDLQIISDLHKSEVYAVARELNIPEIALITPPTGDVYDGKSHLEMIGAPYDFVELYLHCLCEGLKLPGDLDASARKQFAQLAERVEQMHRFNAHKYRGGNPSVHLDIYERAVPGGWSTSQSATPADIDTPRRLVGEFSLDEKVIDTFRANPMPAVSATPLADCTEELNSVSSLLYLDECLALIEALESTHQVPVGTNGRVKDYNPSTDTAASYRATLYHSELAGLLWERLRGAISPVRCFDEYSMTDSSGHSVWRAVGVNPSLRFIKYSKGGTLVPHYDAGYDYQDGKRHTLMSLVIYLTDGIDGCGGRTRFILDTQRSLPSTERDYGDWTRAAEPHEIVLAVQPNAGGALLFDHRMLHDAEGWQAETPRIIIRTDIVFERCGESTPVESCDRADAPSATLAHLSEKAERDPFFRHTSTHFSQGELVEAGFFDDDRIESFDPSAEMTFMSTALHKVIKNHNRLRGFGDAEEKKPVVLISTGGFSPVHQGHLAMMESARHTLEQRGFSVIGGFLAPDHDQYVRQKCGADAIPAYDRLHYIDLATEESDWLAADPWPSRYASCALNFTDIIRRMERYLSRHLLGLAPVRVMYVCGGDNALFARAFIGRGGCVIVHRPGEREKMEKLHAELGTFPPGRIFLAEALLPQPAASRLIRQGDTSLLPDAVQQAWKQRQAQPSIRIYLRDEGSWSTADWAKDREASEVERARRDFLAGVRLACIKVFNTGASRRDFAFRTLSASQQAQKLKEYLRKSPLTPVSLDAVIPAERNISISRCFELSDSRRRGDFTIRPGALSLSSQLSSLGSGSFLFYDDDIATGQTIRALAEALPSGTRIGECLSLFSLVTNDELNTVEMNGEEPITDIGDLRDFLVGSREGGLAVYLADGTIARAPYMLPYVRNSRRMSIPLSEEVEFSRLLWKLNVDFFSQISRPITVQECSADFRRLACSLGWQPDSSMRDFALWHLSRLDQRKDPQQAAAGEQIPASVLGYFMDDSGPLITNSPVPEMLEFGADTMERTA